MHHFSRYTLLLFCCLVCCAGRVSAQLSLQLVNPTDFDGSQYPLYTAKVQATLNGQPFRLTTASVLIREDVQVSEALSVSEPENGLQSIRWYSRSRDVGGGNATIVAFSGNYATSLAMSQAVGMGYQSRTPQVRVYNLQYKPLREVAFGKVSAGSSLSLKYDCVATSGKFDASRNELMVRIDSIRTETPYFQAKWIGGTGCYTLPGYLFSPLDYALEISFKPAVDQYYHDVMTIYYEGGAVERVALSGNEFPLPQRTVLNIISPNGGEVLAPCQKVPVKWRGSAVGSTTIVEYSSDAGTTWIEAGRSQDSMFVWTVPDSPTNTLQLRIKGVIENTDEVNLQNANLSNCDRLAFSPDSRSLLACYRNSEAVIFDANVGTVTARNFYRADAQINAGTQAFGCGFSSATRFYVAYRCTVPTAKSDTLCFFNQGNANPTAVVALDSEFRYKAALLDSTRSFLVVVPQLGTTLQIRSALDGALQRTLTFPAPVTTVSLGKSQAAVALLNGHIQLVDLTSWATVADYHFTGMPVMDQILMMPDNRRIAVGCHVSAFTMNEAALADGYIIDIATAQIVRTQRKSATSPVCVSANATSRYVLFGYVAIPQAPLWDISPNQVYSTVVSHSGSLNDLVFSPSGLLIASASSSTDNLKIKQFVYPEIDYSDSTMRIVRQTLSSVKATIDPTYAFSTRDSLITLNLCNTGEVPVEIDGVGLLSAANFVINGSMVPDTIAVGACARIPIRFAPLDTGKLSDAFRISSCKVNFDLPLEGYSIPRSLGIPDTIDFGDVCPNQVVEKDIRLVYNQDPVKIVMNRAYLSDETGSWFKTISVMANDTVAAHDSLRYTIRFSPKAIGTQTKVLLVYYGGQSKVYSRVVLRGRGVGTNLDVQPPSVAFMSNQTTRSIVLNNTNDNPVTINSLSVSPTSAYSMDAVTLPLIISAHDSVVIIVHWLDTTQSSGALQAVIAPCSSPVSIAFDRYKGSATLRLVDVKADPNGDAVIPISMRLAENIPYGAERTLDAEFSMNPRMFLPQSVSSWLGQVSLTRNEIVNDRRLIGLRLRANFPLKDTIIAEIRGVAGLAETDQSSMVFSSTAAYFGPNVSMLTQSGSFTLTNLCGDRRLVRSGTLALVAIQPTPVDDHVHLSLSSDQEESASVRIYTAHGERVYEESLSLRTGLAQYSLDLHTLGQGSYTIVVQSAHGSTSSLLLVAR